MSVISAGYVGEVVKGDAVDIIFNTVDASGTPIPTFTGAGGTGAPTFRYRNVTSATTGTSGLSPPVINIGGLDGVHSVKLDTTNLDPNSDYSLEITTGELAGVDVSNTVVGTFNCSGRAAGRVYEQSVKCDAGSVANSAGATRTFQITGVDIEDATDDYYATQVLKFSPGAANKNIGRTILTSTPLGSNTCEITVQDAFPKAMVNGDPMVILPEERELTVYTANITVEYGLSTSQGDQYSVQWFANGEPIADADTVLSAMGLVLVRWSDDVAFVSETWPGGNITWAPNAQLFKYNSSFGSGIQPNDGVTMKASGTIDGIKYEFSRTLFNYA